jgi:glycerol uptake facilitator-like aquaporin
MALIYSGAEISGAHLNPAITAILALLGKMPAKAAAAYVLAQLGGAVGGGFLARGIAQSLPDPSGVVSAEENFVDGLFSYGLVITALQTAVAKSRAGNSFFGAWMCDMCGTMWDGICGLVVCEIIEMMTVASSFVPLIHTFVPLLFLSLAHPTNDTTHNPNRPRHCVRGHARGRTRSRDEPCG